MKIAHVINPVRAPEESDLSVAQPITFKTILNAKDEAEKQGIEVDLFTAQYPEDRDIVPESFTLLPDMQRSVLDFGEFRKRRKLPLIRDILGLLHERCGDADFMMYTNVDIALMPFCYAEIADMADNGHDAVIINRRTITAPTASGASLTHLYSLAGKTHPGWDCFVFRKAMFPMMDFQNACIGAPHIGQILYANLAMEARRFREFKDLHLTFHVGDDRGWVRRKYADYWEHNRRQLEAVLQNLESRHGRMNRRRPPGLFHLAVEKNRFVRKLKQVYYRAIEGTFHVLD